MVGASIMTVTWRFDPLFLGDQSRLAAIVIGALPGGVCGNVTASAGGLNPNFPVPGAISGSIVGLIGGALVGFSGLATRDRDEERSSEWDAFYERRRDVQSKRILLRLNRNESSLKNCRPESFTQIYTKQSGSDHLRRDRWDYQLLTGVDVIGIY